MKKCELCKVPARIFCESDQASLCWDCDAKVHSANFLVARHSRTLLCHACRSPTPWKASGARLGNTLSVCEGCVARTNAHQQEEEEDEAEESEGGNDEEINRESDEEDGDNQVVPLSSTPPPPAASSASSEESVTTTTSLKRQREDVDASSNHDFQEGANSLASKRRYGGELREEAACHGEPPSKGWLKPWSLNDSRRCRNGRASDDAV